MHKYHGPLPPFSVFLIHLFKNISLGLMLIGIALFAGMLGYHHYEALPWVDAFENAAMILSGMGPATDIVSKGGKIFAGIYALFSGLFFILIIGIILAPVTHRLFHQFHIALTGGSRKKTVSKPIKK